jgi:hypothetical protein
LGNLVINLANYASAAAVDLFFIGFSYIENMYIYSKISLSSILIIYRL